VEQKELWPGAGLWLDVPNITADDFAKVERRLKEIGDTLAQISFLKKLEIEFRDLEERHRASLRRAENVKEEAEEMKNPVIMDFMRRSIGFKTDVFVKLEKLIAIRKIEREEERERREMPALAPSDSKGIETDLSSGKWVNEQAAESGMLPNPLSSDVRDKPEFSAAQCCLVIHYLLHAARELEKIEKKRLDKGRRSSGVKETDEMIAADEKPREKAFKRLLVALTGWGEDAIRKGRAKMFTDRHNEKSRVIVRLRHL
jgi:hypothetical protein